VISGEAHAIAAVVARARAMGAEAVTLPVSHAFHSELVAEAAPILATVLGRERFDPLQGNVISTVTGSLLALDTNLRELICSQVTRPVRFLEAVVAASRDVDLWIEVGPGSVLSGLVRQTVAVPVISLDAGGSSLEGLLKAVGAAFVLGAPIHHRELFEGRLTGHSTSTGVRSSSPAHAKARPWSARLRRRRVRRRPSSRRRPIPPRLPWTWSVSWSRSDRSCPSPA